MRGRLLARRFLALTLTLGLGAGALGPSVAHAAPDAEAGEEDETFATASKLYDEGRGKFETADYTAAVELWTKAYTALPATPRYAKIKALLLYDLASARQRAFEVDNRASHLRQARILLENFEASIPSLYGHGHEATAERQRVQERLADLDAVLAEVGSDTPEEDPETDDPGAPTPVVVVEPEQPADDPGRSKKRMVAGGVMLGVGVASLGLLAAGLVMGNNANDISGLAADDIDGRRSQFDRGRAGNAMAVVGGVLGGALIITGAVFMGAAKDKPGRSARVAPAVGPGFAGLSAAGRF